MPSRSAAFRARPSSYDGSNVSPAKACIDASTEKTRQAIPAKPPTSHRQLSHQTARRGTGVHQRCRAQRRITQPDSREHVSRGFPGESRDSWGYRERLEPYNRAKPGAAQYRDFQACPLSCVGMLTACYESSTTSLDHIDPKRPLMDPALSPLTIDPM